MFVQSTWSFVARIIGICSIAVLLVIDTASSAPSKAYGHVRIVNGTTIPISDAPWTVQITGSTGIWVCAGTLVSPQFIVSAAHCFRGYPRTELRVMAGVGTLDAYQHTEMHELENYWIHPEYIFKSDDHMDVAVLKLLKPLEIRKDNWNIQPIQMCTQPLKAGQSIQIVGWGRTNFDIEDRPNELQSIIVPVFSKDDCIEMHKDSNTTITDSMVCAGYPGYQDACSGDSGGPAVRRNKLCGIVSWGVGCAEDSHPGVYTSIPVVRDFIDKCMKL